MDPAANRYTSCFASQLDSVLKAFPNAKSEITGYLRGVSAEDGDQLRGFPVPVFKTRLPIKSYKIGKRGGLRLIFMVLPNRPFVPLNVYTKTDYPGEQAILATAKRCLGEAIKMIKSGTL